MTDAERNELVEKLNAFENAELRRGVFHYREWDDCEVDQTIRRMVSSIESLGYEIVKKRVTEPARYPVLTKEQADEAYRRDFGPSQITKAVDAIKKQYGTRIKGIVP